MRVAGAEKVSHGRFHPRRRLRSRRQGEELSPRRLRGSVDGDPTPFAGRGSRSKIGKGPAPTRAARRLASPSPPEAPDPHHAHFHALVIGVDGGWKLHAPP